MSRVASCGRIPLTLVVSRFKHLSLDVLRARPVTTFEGSGADRFQTTFTYTCLARDTQTTRACFGYIGNIRIRILCNGDHKIISYKRPRRGRALSEVRVPELKPSPHHHLVGPDRLDAANVRRCTRTGVA